MQGTTAVEQDGFRAKATLEGGAGVSFATDLPNASGPSLNTKTKEQGRISRLFFDAGSTASTLLFAPGCPVVLMNSSPFPSSPLPHLGKLLLDLRPRHSRQDPYRCKHTHTRTHLARSMVIMTTRARERAHAGRGMKIRWIALCSRGFDHWQAWSSKSDVYPQDGRSVEYRDQDAQARRTGGQTTGPFVKTHTIKASSARRPAVLGGGVQEDHASTQQGKQKRISSSVPP